MINQYLPRPLPEELRLGKKVEYFIRLINKKLSEKYNITEYQLYDWISNNYNSVYLNDKQITYKESQKLN